jgi:hypothetical protein
MKDWGQSYTILAKWAREEEEKMVDGVDLAKKRKA